MAKKTKQEAQQERLSLAEKRNRQERRNKKSRKEREQEKRRKKQERDRRKQKNIPTTAQQSIPYIRMLQDGICQVTKTFFSKTIQFYDINYQLALNEDKTTIFENYCDFLNYFDSSISVQLSFINQQVDVAEFEKSIDISDQNDDFNAIREEYRTMLKNQLSKGNNGLVKTKYITFGIEAESLKVARPRLERIETDILNNFKILGAQAHSLNGLERLEILYHVFNQDRIEPFKFQYKMLPETGLKTKDFIAPTSFNFSKNQTFLMGRTMGSVSYLQILAPELTDRMLADFLDVDDSINVNIHIQSIDQSSAIKMIKSKISDLDKMKIEEQKRAVRSGYDMDVLPSDLVTYGEEAKNLLEDLQSRNERMFLVTVLVMNTAKKRQKLDNNIFQVQGIAQKYNCSLKQLDYQQEAALMSCIPLGVNRIEIQRGLTTSSTAIFVPFTTQELFQEGEALYYGLNALSNNMIMVDRKRLKNPNGLILGTPGSGKSFSAKREITNCFLITEDDIIVCDPEAEYSALVQALHGQVVRVSPVSDQYINPMDLNLNYSEEDNPLSLKADFILSLCELIVGGKNGLEPVEKTIIDRCVRLVYQEYLADPVPEKMPILEDLYNLLRKQEEPEAQRLATSLEIYVTGSLKDVTFEIYAAEDIKAADGESSDYYKKDELVATITTDALGYARSEDLPLGKYYVKEKETADGYVLDGEIREVDLTYRDQNTPVVTYDEDWQNNRQKAKVTVVKKEKNTDRVLEGGVFALYTKNDILNAEGEVILKADTMIEQKATDQDGRIVFTADLPINGSYYVKEVQAPAGFVTTEEIKEFDFAYAGEEVAEVSFEFTYEDEPTTFEITKSDLTTGEELPGAKLKVSDPEGNVVDEWTSGSTPHIIKELEVGKKYTLTETIPADGYATAESITFVVENTADIQKVEMQDDTTKILISKVDMTDGSSEVKGAKLYILNENQEVMESWTSGDQHHYVEKLPIGTYTLLEETAPKGYIVANKVTFEVKDTGDVQGAKMEDEQAMGKVILNKTDKDTKKPMKGVEFALCDSKGKVLETLVTDSAGHAESKNYPIATFKNGQYKKAITYILKETKTLDGYQLDETEHKIQFEYVNDRTPVIEYTLDLTNKKAPEKDTPETSENQGVSTPVSHGSDATSVSNSPKTGDNTNIAIFVLALAVSAGCLGTVVTVKRKRK